MQVHPVIFSAILLSVCSICSLLRAGVIQENFNSLAHGDIVFASNPDQTQSGNFGGFTVRGDNLHDSRDFIVGFDTNLRNTRDDDLESPFVIGNNTNFDYENALIIQERGVGTDNDTPGQIDNPDDEGRRPAGSISFDFDEAVVAFGIDLLDIEGPLEDFSFDFFSNGSLVRAVEFEEFLSASERTDGVDGGFFDPIAPVVFGNNSANRIAPITAQELGNVSGFDSVTVNLGGSGAVDNVFAAISFGPVPISSVPEPNLATLWMMAGVIGLCGLERRKKHMKFQHCSFEAGN